MRDAWRGAAGALVLAACAHGVDEAPTRVEPTPNEPPIVEREAPSATAVAKDAFATADVPRTAKRPVEPTKPAAPPPMGRAAPSPSGVVNSERRPLRPLPKAACVAARMDPDWRDCRGSSHVTFDGDSTPPTRGRLLDSQGAVARHVVLRFWTPRSSTYEETDEEGAFSFELDEDDEFDVDAILERRWRESVNDVRVHVGLVRSGARDVVLRLPVSPVVLTAGTMTETSGEPLVGWSVSLHERRPDGSLDWTPGSTYTDGRGAFRIESWIDRLVELEVHGPCDEDRWWEIVEDARSRSTHVIGHHVVEGTVVVQPPGRPSGAKVSLWRDDGARIAETLADERGAFCFIDVDPKARHEIGVELAGFEPRARCPFDVDDRSKTVDLTCPSEHLSGRATAADGAPLADRWVRFVAKDGRLFECLTDDDGEFATVNAGDAEFEAFLLVPAADGRLVPGPSLGRCRGGQHGVELRASR